ncbi:MAG TPA: response regulator [Terriglobales bacterium]|nr:response regulator [Terriglobales bacterium]
MKRRILLADADLAVQLALRKLLEMHGFEVETASSAREAIAKLDSGPFHMVITAMAMESESAGSDLILAAQRQPYNPATAVLTELAETGPSRIGAQSVLVRANAQDLVRQIEALLIHHEDGKGAHAKGPVAVPAPHPRQVRRAR